MQDFLSIIFDDLHLTDTRYFFISAGAPWHARVEVEGRALFHAVLQGRAAAEVDGQRFILEAGDIFIVPTGCRHRLSQVEEGPSMPETDISGEFTIGHRREPVLVGEPGTTSAFLISASCSFDVELGQPLMSALPRGVPLHGLGVSPPEWLRIGIQFLMHETQELRPGHQSILNRLGDIWFVECLRLYVENLPEGNDSWLRALKDPALATVLSAIHRSPGHDWTVPALAQLACLSRSAFADRFHRIMGKPPLTYVAEHRMRIAAWQLRHSEQPVCRIAEMVGYASETAFGQAFKRIHGVAPGRYREQLRAADESASAGAQALANLV